MKKFQWIIVRSWGVQKARISFKPWIIYLTIIDGWKKPVLIKRNVSAFRLLMEGTFEDWTV